MANKKGQGSSTLLKSLKCKKGHPVSRLLYNIDPSKRVNKSVPTMVYCATCDIMFNVVLVQVRAKVAKK